MTQHTTRPATLLVCAALLAAGGPALGAPPVHAPLPDGARCVAPAKPGGGFDLTCELARTALQASAQGAALPTVYLPGGIGAMAFNTVVRQQPADARTIVAFSAGSLLNLAQGRFGPYSERDVRWVAALGLDHGVIAVRRDAPYASLGELVAALRRNPGTVVFGAGGTIGSQDWMKAALLARAAGVSHKTMRFVAFEGGGEALSALAGGHVQVLAGDAAEVARQMRQGLPVRVLAVLADKRLPGSWANVPTAREQGFDIRWPILRGVYVGPQVPDAAYRQWVDAFTRAQAHAGYTAALAQAGLLPAPATGAALELQIAQHMARYRALVAEFGLRPK